MRIPAFRNDGWLPADHHRATWSEVEAVFGGTPGSRHALVFRNLAAWRDAARARGLSGLVVLDESFVSQRENPGNFDLIFVFDESTGLILKTDLDAQMLVNYVSCKTKG